MKKILLVTLQGDNIGNRLQNYALQEKIKEMNFEVYNPYYNLTEFDSVRKRIEYGIKVFLASIGVKKYKPNWIRKKRLKKYSEFNSKYIDNMFKINFSDIFKRNWEEFDYSVTGSDQVWHGWTNNKYELLYFYLEFMPISKRVSYAPSFGFDEFPKEQMSVHLNSLNKMANLSIREKSGADLIEKYVARDAKLVLDPTLLLSASDWKRIEKPSPLYKGKDYILVYFLGEKDIHYINDINKISRRKNLDIIDVYDRDNFDSMLTTPDEFIWLVEHAEYVCTDSFHATVFSILFHKKFLSFKRKEFGMDKMFNRIENILSIYNLVDRVYDNNIEKIEEEYTTRDISLIIEESESYLKESLGLKNE